MSFITKGPSTPAVPALPKALPPPPTILDPAVTRARTEERARAALAGGTDSTILTGASGLVGSGNTATKTLLGQ